MMKVKNLIKFVVPVALAVAAGAYVWGGATARPQLAQARIVAAGTATPAAKAKVVVKTPTQTVKAQAIVTSTVSAPIGLYKDKQGRPYGGNWPFINYTPSMVTGKPCPRVTKWKLDAKDYPVDRCVIQNAIDDYMLGAFAEQRINSADEMKAIAKEFTTNPELAGVYVPGWGTNLFGSSR